jgi:hypothetical protein
MRASRQPSCTTRNLAPAHRGLANGSPVCAGTTTSDETSRQRVPRDEGLSRSPGSSSDEARGPIVAAPRSHRWMRSHTLDGNRGKNRAKFPAVTPWFAATIYPRDRAKGGRAFGLRGGMSGLGEGANSISEGANYALDVA